MERVDVVIIGSGYGGAIPAARLAEAGMSVVVLERGPRKSAADLRQSDDLKYIQTIVELVISDTNVGFRTGTMVGGASIPMDGAHFRMPEKSYEVTDSLGRRYWPESYTKDSMAPYFSMAEEMLLVRQRSWDEIPKAGGLFAKMLDVYGASCDRALLNYTDCLNCGFCAQGCIYEKKMDLLHNYIPLAESYGAEFRADAMVDHLEPDGTGYVVHYALGGSLKEIRGDRVIVAGGGIHSPALLLRSTKYLPNISLETGEHFNNNGEHAFIGILPEEFAGVDLDSYFCYQGMDNAGVMCFHWFDEEGFTLHPGAGLEPSIFAAALAEPNHDVLPGRAWGMEFKR
ncbi:MAG: GMC family oxidoreductase, partial [Proteobacteria bacterium]|nr:GMC family oxidoreductase [Pseudomonadota bacterium]